MEYAALALALLSIIGSIVGTTVSTNKQIAHDREMADINLENQKKLLDYEAEQSQSINTMATQKNQAAAAGFSPALLYGQMSTPGLYDSGSASNTGTSSSLEPLRMFDKVPTSDVVQTMLTKRSQDITRERNLAAIQLDRARSIREAAETARTSYDTDLRKRMEKIVFDQQMANLHLTEAQGKNLEFMTGRAELMLPLELEQQHLINERTAAQVNNIVSDTSKNYIEMSQIRKDIERLDSVIDLNNAEKNSVVESTKRSAVGRVMQEFGLTSRLLPSQLRSASALHNALNNEQMKGAYVTLRTLGFSEQEATNAVIYYTAKDPKDVSPSILNSASRIFSALVLKK